MFVCNGIIEEHDAEMSDDIEIHSSEDSRVMIFAFSSLGRTGRSFIVHRLL